MVKGKKIAHRTNVVLAVSGSIAAFKSAALASLLVQEGFDVRAILTPGGAHFVQPLTFEAITGHRAFTEVWEEQPGSSAMGHLELARWADALVVAPASASAISKLALGFADDLLGAVALACRAPLIVAPAMESAMFQHPATQGHLDTLRRRGAIVVGPESGRLASGAEGAGRMSEPATIAATIRDVLQVPGDLAGKRVLVTAGPTLERIDNVRYIGNRSSGKTGYAIAQEARDRGAEVLLISGPVSIPPPQNVLLRRVESAEDMRQTVVQEAVNADVIVMAAAVGDFRPSNPVDGKLKRGEALDVHLSPTADIAAEVARANPRAIHVGFALEADNLVESTRSKLEGKGLDLVVGNLANESHDPFGSEANQVIFVTRDAVEELPLLDKREVARRLWDTIQKLL